MWIFFSCCTCEEDKVTLRALIDTIALWRVWSPDASSQLNNLRGLTTALHAVAYSRFQCLFDPSSQSRASSAAKANQTFVAKSARRGFCHFKSYIDKIVSGFRGEYGKSAVPFFTYSTQHSHTTHVHTTNKHTQQTNITNTRTTNAQHTHNKHNTRNTYVHTRTYNTRTQHITPVHATHVHTTHTTTHKQQHNNTRRHT